MQERVWGQGFILFVIFLEGFVSISVEILAIRQLIPMVGNSVIVTSLIIGIFLLFLAMGYWRGGVYEGNFNAILRRNFIIAAIFIGIGLSYSFMMYFFVFFGNYFLKNFLIILIVYLLLVIAPIIYCLGQTVPLTMNLVDQEHRAAKIGGRVLFLSTLGSFLGAILTSLLLMEFLGVAWTVFINFLILILMSFIFIGKYKKELLGIVLILGMTLFVYKLNVAFEGGYFITTTNYANYRVSQTTDANSGKRGKVLESNNSFSSFVGDKNKQAFPYVELIKRILFKDLKLHDAQILVLGAGGFTLSAAGDHGNHFTYVDVDPKIKTVVKKHFLSSINGKFIAQDARVYLVNYGEKNPHKKYDVIISDVYSNLITIPPELLTQEHFANIKKALKNSGFAIFNIIARPFFNDNYSRRVDMTIRKVFNNCVAVPLEYSDSLTNIIYICRKEKNAYDENVYTDNRNAATIDFMLLNKGNI